jgi:hypothetical protein
VDFASITAKAFNFVMDDVGDVVFEALSERCEVHIACRVDCPEEGIIGGSFGGESFVLCDVCFLSAIAAVEKRLVISAAA